MASQVAANTSPPPPRGMRALRARGEAAPTRPRISSSDRARVSSSRVISPRSPVAGGTLPVGVPVARSTTRRSVAPSVLSASTS